MRIRIPCSHLPMVARSRLMKELDSSLEYKLLFVCAPAGYGKTTAVAEWVRRRKRKVCWLSLNQLDNQPIVFLRNLYKAIVALCAGNVEQLEDAGNSSESLTQTIIKTVTSLQTELFIILDNYQVIEQPCIHDLVSNLLKMAPECLHMIIVSRSELPASFAAFYLQGQVQELRTQALQMQAQEIAAFCRLHNISATKGDILNLAEITEGWPAGLHFALLDAGISGAPFTDSALTNNLYIAAYFETEVWQKLPQDMQEFSLKTAIFDTLTAKACEAVMATENSGRLLALLHKNGAFLFALADDGGWYRYHFLYKAFLRRKLEKLYKHQLPELHRRAGEWLAQHFFLRQAIEHTLQANDYDKVAELTVAYAKDSFSRGYICRLLALLNSLPQTIIESNPLLLLAYTWAELLAGNFETYQVHQSKLAAYDFAAANVPDHIAEKIKNEINIIRAVAAFKHCSDIDECLALNQAAQGHGSFFMSQSIDFNYGEASLLNRTRKIPLDKIMNLALQMKAIWPGISPPDGAWSVFLGEILYERNDLDNAICILNEGIDLAERAKIMSIFVIGSITLARIARAKGNLARAALIIDNAAKKIETHKAFEWLRILDAFRIWLWLDSHELKKCAGWLASYDKSLRDRQTQLLEYEQIARIRTLLALGRFDESAILLQQCLNRARNENRVNSMVVLLTLQAIARHGAGDHGGSLLSLKEALVMARRYDYLRSFVDEGAPVVTLLRKFLNSHLARQDAELFEFGNTLLRLTIKHVDCLKSAVSLCRPSVEIGRLTLREQEILRLLGSGQTNVAIAEISGVSVNTVKSHIRNLYGKLGVRNRVQAITIARNMQLW